MHFTCPVSGGSWHGTQSTGHRKRLLHLNSRKKRLRAERRSGSIQEGPCRYGPYRKTDKERSDDNPGKTGNQPGNHRRARPCRWSGSLHQLGMRTSAFPWECQHFFSGCAGAYTAKKRGRMLCHMKRNSFRQPGTCCSYDIRAVQEGTVEHGSLKGKDPVPGILFLHRVQKKYRSGRHNLKQNAPEHGNRGWTIRRLCSISFPGGKQGGPALRQMRYESRDPLPPWHGRKGETAGHTVHFGLMKNPYQGKKIS